MARYILHPGKVLASDGDIHEITATQLIDLYQLRPETHDTVLIYGSIRGISPAGFTHLYPRQDGKYDSPERPIYPEIGEEFYVWEDTFAYFEDRHTIWMFPGGWFTIGPYPRFPEFLDCKVVASCLSAHRGLVAPYLPTNLELVEEGYAKAGVISHVSSLGDLFFEILEKRGRFIRMKRITKSECEAIAGDQRERYEEDQVIETLKTFSRPRLRKIFSVFKGKAF